MSLAEFHVEFFQEIASLAGAHGNFKPVVFFEKMAEHVIGTGELETADYVPWVSGRKDARVDGYGGDPREADGVLTLIVSDFQSSPELGRLNSGDIASQFEKLVRFIRQARDSKFRASLEESSPAFGLADTISARWASLTKIRLVLFTNRELRARVDGLKAGAIDGVETTYNVWDIARLHRLVLSGRAQEDRDIDLVDEFGGAIPALRAHLDNTTYEAFLMVVPGRQLAAIYDRWGPRLLEQNVRSFLQARGSVNKGIRKTIDADPEMFFAYNNGLTATAEAIETEMKEGVLSVLRLKNLQIVNGGQTTASIHAASRTKGCDLSRVSVQMKLSIVSPERSEEVVPKISEFANSQNKVNAADFFANHPFHIEMEKLSRRIYVPSVDGGFIQTKWFYERARGQYADERARRTEAHRKKFDVEYPKSQLLTKTDLAKVLSVWSGQPHIVARGAQKNFIEFAKQVGETWEAREDDYNETFFRESVAKAIIFRETEKIVSEQPWYTGGGSRAPIVAYAIAKLAHDVKQRGDAINFDLVWRMQDLPSALKGALEVATAAANELITRPPVVSQSITEWAKQPACWKRAQDVEIVWPDDLDAALIMKTDADGGRRSARLERKMINGIEAQTVAVKAGHGFWAKVLEWARANHRMSPADAGILQVLATPGRIGSDKQCLRALELLTAMNEAGCRLQAPDR
ncbi:AIPR family protein [Bosea sp. BK604]|uniref:AIPR family protein n=1 Tax=Bosea sp. BK604 TaxID=2512180 RepID=UPI001048A56A|nr:AIPR family protein [Bosea sp. BK604]TCR63174.1 AIPR protein [Bosea sp. BK604]